MPITIPSEAERAREVRKTIRDAFAKDVTRLTGLESSFEFAFAKPDRKWRSDIAWPDVRVALEMSAGESGWRAKVAVARGALRHGKEPCRARPSETLPG